MLRTNNSIANLTSSSLVQSLVNHRPKSQQQHSIEKTRVSSAKQKPSTFKLVTSSLCGLKQQKPELMEPQQSNRMVNSAKKQSIIQRTMPVKQKTVKLSRDSRSSSKKDLLQPTQIKVELKVPPVPVQIQIKEETEESVVMQENPEANQKINQLISKYKNVSYFSQDSQKENKEIVIINNAKEISETNNRESLTMKEIPAKPQEQSKAPEQPKLQEQDSNISKYVTRVSKGASIIPLKPKPAQPRKRMNSPIHRQRTSKENNEAVSQSLRGLSAPKKLQSEFDYYMTLVKFFNSTKKNENQIRELFNNSAKTQLYFSDLYQDHFQQSYHALQFCREIPKPSMNQLRVTNLPPNKFKKTIVFDLDETLIHCQENNEEPSDVVLNIKFPTGEVVEAGINVRPYCREMLQQLSQKYEIIVFTASHECYAQKVLGHLDPEKRWIHHRFFRDSCFVANDGLHIKDLRILGNRQLKDMVLVDNASYSFCFQMENGIPIIPFYDNPLDKELQYLTQYLTQLMSDPDMLNKNYSYFKHQLYMSDFSLEQVALKL